MAPLSGPREDRAVSGPTSKTYVVTVGKEGIPQSIELRFDGQGAWTAKASGRDMAMQLHDVSAEGVVQITVTCSRRSRALPVLRILLPIPKKGPCSSRS